MCKNNHDNKFDIVVDDVQYNDMITHLYLPTTIVEKDVGFKKKYLVNPEKDYPDETIDIGYNEIQKIINNKKKLDINKNYRFTFDFYLLDNITYSQPQTRPIYDIKITTDIINQGIFSSNGYVGIHVRRNNGVSVNEKDILSLPENLRKKYEKIIQEQFRNMDPAYRYYRDEQYFNVLEEILKINPTQKFYVSHDLTEKYFLHWKKHYPNKIFTRIDFMKNETDISLNNLYDLFFLSHTPFMIASPGSSWSRFACFYKEKFWNNIDHSLEHIKHTYEKYYHQTLDIN